MEANKGDSTHSGTYITVLSVYFSCSCETFWEVIGMSGACVVIVIVNVLIYEGFDSSISFSLASVIGVISSCGESAIGTVGSFLRRRPDC